MAPGRSRPGTEPGGTDHYDVFYVSFSSRSRLRHLSDAVHAGAGLGLLRGDGEAELFLQRPGHGAADGVIFMPTSA
jgi:hypothetical protein